jgi:hypothetical protein
VQALEATILAIEQQRMMKIAQLLRKFQSGHATRSATA